MIITRQNLIDSGIADTRLHSLMKGCNALHDAVAYMDKQNRAILKAEFPELFVVAQAYGRGCEFLDSFED